MDAPDLIAVRDSILEEALPAVAFEGWSRETLREAARRAGHPPDMADAAFPGGPMAAIDHFSDLADRKMLKALENVSMEALKIRDRVRLAVLTRLDVLAPHREAVRLSAARWALSPRTEGVRSLWHTADRIWKRAGDTSTDYNRYTKRSLLVGVLVSTTLAWMGDTDPQSARTKAFLDRRIENVMTLGRAIGRFKKRSAPRQETAP
jgi:ubiquinone biosynthesis protein COQ9